MLSFAEFISVFQTPTTRTMHQTSMTATHGGTNDQPASNWVGLIEAQAHAQAEEEIKTRRYIQSPKQTAGLAYDDRLHIRLGCGKTKAYELLQAGEEGGGLRSIRIGNKYIVTEQAVREFFGDVARSTMKAA